MVTAKRSRIESMALLLRRTLNYPKRVLTMCLVFLAVSVLLNGSLFRIWSLRRDHMQLQQQMADTASLTQKLEIQLHQAKDPAFIERQARDKLDMVNEDDLVFVFSDGP